MNDYRESMAGSSRQAAAAFLEDMEHVRALLKQPKPVNQSIRALSVTLRRLLVNGELAILAASRVGKILISAPDYHPVHVAQRKGAIDYFFGGPCPVFNRDLGSVGAYMLPVGVKVPNSPSPLSGLDPEAKIQLTLDSFMKQQVVCLMGNWITRKDIIKHEAIFGSAAHSRTPNSPMELVIARLRNSLVATQNDSGLHIAIDDYWNNSDPKVHTAFVHRKEGANGLQLQLLGTASCLVESPDIERLEEAIGRELT